MTAQTRRTLLRCCAAGTGVTILSTSTHAQDSDAITTATPQEVPAAADATIAGETTLSDDVTLTVTVRSASGVSPRFRYQQEISPTDGSWRVTFDMSAIEPGSGFTLTVRDTDGQSVITEDWTVVDPDLFFTIDSLTLAAETTDSTTGTFGDSWSRELAPIAPGETRSLDVRPRADDELLVFSDRESIELETRGGITATADGMTITLTATELGEATLQLTIISERNPDFQAPPLSLTVSEPAETPSDNASDDESNNTTEGDVSTDADETPATANTTDDTAEREPAASSDATTDSTPGFTVLGTLAALGGAGYLLRERLGL